MQGEKAATRIAAFFLTGLELREAGGRVKSANRGDAEDAENGNS
jgi:hypothetical protein